MNAWREILARVPHAEELFLPFAIDVDNFSDYERLCALCDVLPLCRSHTVAESVIEAVKNMLAGGELRELGALSASAVWVAYNRLRGFGEYSDFLKNEQEFCCKICVEKYNDSVVFELGEALCASATSYAELVGELKGEAQRAVICVRIFEERFSAPNRYIAEGVFNKLKKGEKCNNIDINCLYSQLLCEILSDKKYNNNGIMIDVKSNVEYARELVEYMHRYNMRGRIFVGINVNADLNTLLQTCQMSSERGIITPVIFMSKNDNFLINKHCIDQLASIYPASLIERVWTN